MNEPFERTSGEPDAQQELLAALAEEFLVRYRRGERPSPEEYIQKHPLLAGEIRDAFPAMLALEQAGEESKTNRAFASEQVGAVIGGYKLLERIGEGGFGMVFMAEQTHPIRRKVALKVIKPGVDTRQVIARFEAERQALALMDHDNIARVFEAGATESGRPYFVMELVQGIPITDYCERNQLEPRQRLELFIQVCRAVQHAHTKGVIHRDVKPTNVLVTLHDGVPVPKVIDFGIAKATAQQLTAKTLFTNFAQMVGTPLYMSPEQAEMSGLDADTRSDIYSLGVLLYELLTGTTPVDQARLKQAAFDEVRRIIREEVPPRPSTRLSTMSHQARGVSPQRIGELKRLGLLVRGELDWIVMKCLEKDRTRRYESANLLALDLQRHLNDEPVEASPPSARYRFGKFARRHRTAVLTVSTITAALLLAVVVLAVSNVRITSERNQKATALRELQVALGERGAALQSARASEADARVQAFRALWNEARARRFSHQIGQRIESLAALTEAARLRPEAGLRDEAIAILVQPDVALGPAWQAIGTVCGAAFDEGYRRCAEADEQGTLSIFTLPDHREIRRIESGRISKGLWLSNDGEFLAQLDVDRTLRVWRVADGELALPDERPKCSAVAFSLDSRQLIVAHGQLIHRFDLASGKEINNWRARAVPSSFEFDPDNRRLAVGYADATVASIYDPTDGTLATDVPVGPIEEQVVAWDALGERLAVAGSDPRIQIWDVAASRKLATLEGHIQQVTALSFHPDGELLVSAGWEGVVRLWHAGSGREVLQWPMNVQPRFSSDGRWLGVGGQGGGKMQLMELVPSPEYRTLVSSLGAAQDDYFEGDLSPDGRLLAMGMRDGVRLWDLAGRREVAFLPVDVTWNVCFQPDGRGLYTSGTSGLRHWPIQSRGTSANDLRVGPPKTLALPFTPYRIALDRNGRKLAVVGGESEAGALLLDLDHDAAAGELTAHPKAGYVALSSDARWIATSGWHSRVVRLWRAQDGQMIHEWSVIGPAIVVFTPDARTLIISDADEFCFWDVETQEMNRRLRRDVSPYPGYVAFSRDGLLMALEMAPGVIHLKEVSTTRTVAKLEDPGGHRAGWLAFSPDGTKLVVTAHYARAIHIWDLRLIRIRLKAMGMDWEWPEFPPADQSRTHSSSASQSEQLLSRKPEPPLTIEVVAAGSR